MCFSAQADLIGGAAISALGIVALRNVQAPRELPIASLPLLLGLHQLVETFVWWGLQGHVSEEIGRVATWAYLLFAFVVLPTYMPLAVIAIEPTRRARRQMAPFAAIGVAVSAVLLAAMIRGPVGATLENYHIGYHTGLQAGGVVVAFYVAATCGSVLLSGYRPLAWFGAVNLVVVAVLATLTRSGFASLWCAWAALSSAVIVAHLVFADNEPGTPSRRRPLTPTPSA